MFTGHENHEISFATGAALTKRYRDNNPGSRKGGYFSKDAILELLDQENCVGMRVYYANDESGEMEMVLVGVASNENDLIGEGNLCMDMCMPCPDRCGESNLLNSDQ
ncbi:MAG: hypothetical protein RL641_427 [Candidatus Parcubacteria bacterium]|jgi:hypothetical protein